MKRFIKIPLKSKDMGLYQHLRETWNNLQNSPIYRERLIKWRGEPVVLRVPKPTRLDRARALGYKAKQGYLIIRVRLRRGGKTKGKPAGGRRSARYGQKKVLKISYQVIAEQRANKRYPNCEVLNSYYVAQDGKNYWYEIILVDRENPQITSDERISWISDQRGRAYRGLTSAGKKARGLAGKGKGYEKSRPSRQAYLRRKWRRQNLYRLG